MNLCSLYFNRWAKLVACNREVGRKSFMNQSFGVVERVEAICMALIPNDTNPQVELTPKNWLTRGGGGFLGANKHMFKLIFNQCGTLGIVTNHHTPQLMSMEALTLRQGPRPSQVDLSEMTTTESQSILRSSSYSM